MDWSGIGRWPNAHLSRRVQGPVHRWHVQETGHGATLLLLHGAGGSTSSFRDIFRDLETDFRVIAIDLPGHGFTQLGARHRSGVREMATDICALCQQEDWQPEAIIGHSAGAAVALRMTEPDIWSGALPRVIGINAALEEFQGLAGMLFPVMAKALAAMPFTASLFSGTAHNPERVRALIASTGSTLDTNGTEIYRKLVGDRDHVNGTLLMMAQWQLAPLVARLPDHPAQVDLIVGTNDKTVSPNVSDRAAQVMRDAQVHRLEGLGHLAPEEAPDQVARLIRGILAC